MGRFITYLLLGAFLLHSTSRMIVYFNYWANQEFIAQNLCENRDEPVMECNGKCHLKKELDKDDDRKQQDQKQQVEVLLFVSQNEIKSFEYQLFDFPVEKSYYTCYNKQIPEGVSNKIFQPPTT